MYDVFCGFPGAHAGSNNPSTPEGFRDENGFPRGLLVPESRRYPEGRVLIETAYPEFTFWRESLCAERTDRSLGSYSGVS